MLCYIIFPSNWNVISAVCISSIHKTINNLCPKVVVFLLSLYSGARSRSLAFLSHCRSPGSYVVPMKSTLQFEKVRIPFLWHYLVMEYAKSFLWHLLQVLFQDTCTQLKFGNITSGFLWIHRSASYASLSIPMYNCLVRCCRKCRNNLVTT